MGSPLKKTAIETEIRSSVDVRERYATHRKHTYTLLEDQVFYELKKKIVATCINEDVAREFRRLWHGHSERLVQFDWAQDGSMLNTLRTSHPKRFELAVWDAQGALCGLAVGRLSNASIWLSLTHIEACPDRNHSLKGLIAPIVFFGAEIYAIQTEAEGRAYRPRVRIMYPLQGAVATYRKMGYTELRQNKKIKYLTRAIKGSPYHESTDRKNS